MSKQAFTVQFFVLLRTLSEFFTSKTHLRIFLTKSVPKCFLSRPIIVFNPELMAQCTAYSTIDFIIHRLRPSPGVAKSCEIGKMPDITSSVKIQTASTSSVGRKSPWKMCQIFSTNTQRFPWYTFEGVDCVILIFQWGILTNFVLLSTSVRIEFEMEQIYADRHSRHKVVAVIFIIIIMITIVISIIVVIALKNCWIQPPPKRSNHHRSHLSGSEWTLFIQQREDCV